ncbi:hypothetical protein PRO82_001488 [Candidatus Protochlamydia amoebophila]|nr:hypothetical protein [Candidatus Protochlamydia amoebophila]
MLLTGTFLNFSVNQPKFLSDFVNRSKGYFNFDLANRVKQIAKEIFSKFSETIQKNNNNNQRSNQNSVKGISMLFCVTIILLLFNSFFRRSGSSFPPPTPRIGDDIINIERQPSVRN